MSEHYYDIEGFIRKLMTMSAHERSEVLQQLFIAGRENLRDEQGRTPLHLAAAFGRLDICLELLERGATNQEKNNAQQTPSNFAASLRQFACSTLINNFISESMVRQFMQPFCLPYWVLPLKYLHVFHKLLLDTNLHPIRIAMGMKRLSSVSLLEATHNSLVLMKQREARGGKNYDAKRVLKIHYLAWLVGKFRDKALELSSSPKQNTNAPLVFVTEYASKRDEDRTLFIYKMIESAMSSLRSVPNGFVLHIMQRLVHNAQNPLGVLHSIINERPVNYQTLEPCNFCHAEGAHVPCERCCNRLYCCTYCLNYDWDTHQHYCYPPEEAAAYQMYTATYTAAIGQYKTWSA